ncbi:hypothetical protein [Pseudolabrys taiwanensis]|nr:hypothetical protein [Pseudolabrys taiwanensis]
MADLYRAQAAQCFERAFGAPDKEQRALWEQLARYWEMMADALEVQFEPR